MVAHRYLVTLTCLISGMGWGLSLRIVLCIMTVCKQITTRHACLTRTHTFVLPLQNALIVAKSHESPVKNNSPRPFSRPADLEGGNISDRLGKIKTSSENWKNRVGKYHVLFRVIVSIVYRRLIILFCSSRTLRCDQLHRCGPTARNQIAQTPVHQVGHEAIARDERVPQR